MEKSAKYSLSYPKNTKKSMKNVQLLMNQRNARKSEQSFPISKLAKIKIIDKFNFAIVRGTKSSSAILWRM